MAAKMLDSHLAAKAGYLGGKIRQDSHFIARTKFVNLQPQLAGIMASLLQHGQQLLTECFRMQRIRG